MLVTSIELDVLVTSIELDVLTMDGIILNTMPPFECAAEIATLFVLRLWKSYSVGNN